MITKRIIPCLDVRDGRVVKGVNFLGVRDVSDPVKLAQYYSESGADELVFYDITATVEGRALFTDILTRVAETIFIPLTVGGGIQTLADFDRVLKCGADKVSVNSGALRDPDLIRQGAERYGNQCVVLSVDAKRVDGSFHVFSHGGRQDTGLDAIDWICRGVDLGAGEIVLNSIDTDGVKEGFDLPMLDALAARVGVPIIASGGAGKMEEAVDTDRKLITFSVVICIVLGGLMSLVAHLFPQIYNTSDSIRGLAASFIRICALCMPINALANASGVIWPSASGG